MKEKKEEDLEEFDLENETSNTETQENVTPDETMQDETQEEQAEVESEEPAKDTYLALAQRIQAEFENYRRRMNDQLILERQEGARSVIDVFLPCLDTFKEAKKSITDEKVLEGVNMIEAKIMEALKKLKVTKIDAVGQKFDPNLHEVIAVLTDETKEDNIVLDEYQAGYIFNEKVIRYSKVIVNKRG